MPPVAGFTAVIVLHDSERELRVLLDSVAVHLAEPPQIVVVDSGSSDGGAELASQLRLLAETIEDEGCELRDRYLTTEAEIALYANLHD